MKLFKDFSKRELVCHKLGQKKMTDMLKEFDKICRYHNLKYWCVGGTLIGAVRHKGWIPHDADIDVAMVESDYKILQKVIQENLSKDYWFQDKTTDKYYNSEIGKIRYLHAQYDDWKDESWHNGLQLDIFVFKENDNILETFVQYGFYFGKYISRQMIFPLKELTFEDFNVYVPNYFQKYCLDAHGGFPPPILPINRQYPHEGRISFNIPKWMKDKYPHLY